MAIKRKDIRDILNNESLDAEKREKALLDLFHAEADELRDRNDELSAELEKAKKDTDAAVKAREKAESDLNSYKDEQSKAQSRSAKEAAYKELLTAAGVSEKRFASILKVADFDSVELDKDGKIKNADKLTESIKTEWADFIIQQEQHGADVQNPPAGKGGKMSKADILSIKDAAERQQAIADNHELFGF